MRSHITTPPSISSQRGFTIFELMIATIVFSVILLVMAAGVLRFSHDYFKGLTTSKTQQVARAIAQDISQNIQFGQSVTAGLAASNIQGICLGNTLYSYRIGYQVKHGTSNAAKHQYPYGMVKRVGTDCSSAVPLRIDLTGTSLNATTDHELLGENMRLTQLDVTDVSVSGQKPTYQISVQVVYGDDDLLTPVPSAIMTPTAWASEICSSSIVAQFCAKSQLVTTVQQRL